MKCDKFGFVQVKCKWRLKSKTIEQNQQIEVHRFESKMENFHF